MTVKINIKHDIKRLQRVLGEHSKLVPKIISQALNRTLQQVETRGARAVAKATGLKNRDVKAEFTKKRSTRKELIAILKARGHAHNIARFSARQTRKGISARAYGVRRIYPRTFLAFGERTGFIRITAERLPIRAVHGPSIPGTLSSDDIEKLTQDVIEERWPINFSQAYNRFIKSDPRVI